MNGLMYLHKGEFCRDPGLGQKGPYHETDTNCGPPGGIPGHFYRVAMAGFFQTDVWALLLTIGRIRRGVMVDLLVLRAERIIAQ